MSLILEQKVDLLIAHINDLYKKLANNEKIMNGMMAEINFLKAKLDAEDTEDISQGGTC